jgi:hypothetical protein
MVNLRKVELVKIWQYLRKKITPADRKWLAKNRAGNWPKGKPKLPFTVHQLSFRIQDVLDAKAGMKEMSYQFAKGLPWRCLYQIAKMLNVEIGRNVPFWQILKPVLRKIDKAK